NWPRITSTITAIDRVTGEYRADQRRRLADTNPSSANNANAVQIIVKPSTRGPAKGSWNNSTAQASCRLGPMYCNSPTVNNGMRRAPTANSTRGTAVNGPPINKSADMSNPRLDMA